MDGNNGNGNDIGNGNDSGNPLGHGHAHGYIQEDAVYDEVMNNSVWPGPGDQFLYTHPQQTHQPQDLYSRYATTTQPQTSYEQYGLSQQPLYPSLEYANPNTNSPYVSHYQQHATPSHVFRPASSSVDPSLQTSTPSPYRGQESTFSVAPNATISPQYLQYAVPSGPPANRGVQSSAFQPSSANGIVNAFSQPPQERSTMYFNDVQNESLHRSMGTLNQYSELPPEKQASGLNPTANHANTVNNTKNYVKLESPQLPTPIPPRTQPGKSTQDSNSLRMTHPELYASKTGRTLEYAPFIVFEDNPIQITLGLKNTIPKYHPRRSRSGRQVIPGFAASRLSTPARGPVKSGRIQKETKVSLSKGAVTKKSPKPIIAGKVATPHEEGGQGAGVKSPATPIESSSSEDESSSEEESEYEDDEDMPLVDVSTIRGPTRPANDVAAAARWDAIGIIWRDPASSPSIEVVQSAIEEYGNFLIELRNKLKAKSKEVDEAAGNPVDVAKLGTERGILLEALYQAIDAANTHGYDAIIENLGRYHKLVNGLTTTLIDCLKMDDYLGKLPRAVFTLLARLQTMTDDLLKKLKFDSIQKRWRKQDDKQISLDIESILANTIDAKERATKARKEGEKAEEGKKVLEKIEKTKLRAADANKAPPVNLAKRPHEGDGTNGKPSKKLATDMSNPTIKTQPPKRSNLLGISSKLPQKPAPKKREVSPPGESKLGALLASIAKPPEPPKAPEAPPRPPETPEEKARRERKESRRHLRVKFKEDPELEEVRWFKHEQAEDEGRQDDMLRDAHDYRSEGIMHKRRVSEARDEEEEIQSGEIEARQYPELVGVDFADLEKSTPVGPKYTTRGGDLTFTTPEQQAQGRREALELMAIYSDLDDIPPSPKEPPVETDSGKENPEPVLKEPTAPWLVNRLQEIRQYGPDYASQLFIRRLEEQQGRKFGDNPAFGSLNSLLTPHHESSPQQPTHHQDIANKVQKPTPTMEPHEYLNLLRIIDSVKGKPYPPVEPPDWMTNNAQRAVWWEGYNRDKAIKENRDATQKAEVEASQYQPPPIQYPPQMTVPQLQSYQPTQTQPSATISSIPSQPDLTQQVQTLLAGYSNGNSTSATQQFDYNAWVASAAAQAQAYASQAQQPRWDGNWNENSNPNKAQDHISTSSKAKRGPEKKEWQESLFDENGEYKGKKKPCRFWKEGKCQKGAKCTYLHD